MSTIPQILNKAADLIEERGFAQGTKKENGRPGGVEGPALCAALALHEAGDALGDYSRADVFDARKVLCAHVGISAEDRLFGVYGWNDEPGRTGEEVVAALRGAALEASA